MMMPAVVAPMMNLCTPKPPSKMPQTPAAILFPDDPALDPLASATPHAVQTTACGCVACPQLWQKLVPARGGTPHFGQATARSSTTLAQFRQCMMLTGLVVLAAESAPCWTRMARQDLPPARA